MAIHFGDGRYRSELLDQERLDELSDYIQGLSEDEYYVFAQMLAEFVNGEGQVDLKDGGQNLTLYETFSRLEYKTQPVDVETWLLDDYYMGRTGESFWPKLREDFIELFSGNYHEVIATGSIGWGKSFFSNLCMCRILYELSCLNNPQQSYGLAPDSQIVLTNYHINLKLSKKVVFQGISSMIQNSPYFMENFKPRFTLSELRFPRNVLLIPISRTSTGSLGLNIFAAIIDECLGKFSTLTVRNRLSDGKIADTFCNVKINDLEIGKKYQLRCYDHKTNKLQEGWGIVGLSAVQPTVYIKTKEGELCCSYEHPVLVRRGNWLVYEYAVSLQVGDEIVTCRSEHGRQEKDERGTEERASKQGQEIVGRAEGYIERAGEAENGKEESVLWKNAYGGDKRKNKGCTETDDREVQAFGRNKGKNWVRKQGEDIFGRNTQEDVGIWKKENGEGWNTKSFSSDNEGASQSKLWKKTFGRRKEENRGCQQGKNSFGENAGKNVKGSQGKDSFKREQAEDFGRQCQSDKRQEAVLFGLDDRPQWDRSSLSVGARKISFDGVVQASECSLDNRRGQARTGRIRIGGTKAVNDSGFYGGVGYGGASDDRSKSGSNVRSQARKRTAKSFMDGVPIEGVQVNAGIKKTFDSRCVERTICNRKIYEHVGQYGQVEGSLFGVRVECLKVEELPSNLKLTTITSIEYREPEQTYKVETEFKTVIANGFITHNTSFQQSPKSSLARRALSGIDEAANYIIDAKTLYNSILRRMKSRFQRAGRLPGKLILPASKRTRNDFTMQRILASTNDPGIFVRDYCFTGDTCVSLMDGRELSFFELEKEFGKDKSFEVYSWNGKDFVPGKAKGVVLTRKNVPVVKVTLDNGESERCTYDHPWMLRDGNYCRAIDLKPGDSLMPLYRRKSTKKIDRLAGYDMWRDPNTGKWIFTHRINAKERFGDLYKKGFNVHHKDFNKSNNSTLNLELVERSEHLKVHSERMDVLLKYVKSDKHRKYASEHMFRLHANKEWAKKRDERSRKNLKKNRENPVYAKRFTDASSRNLRSWLQSDKGKAENRRKALELAEKRKLCHVTVEEIIRFIDLGMNSTMVAKEFGCSQALVSKRLKHLGGFAKVAKSRNHRVVSVEPDGFSDVYDIKEVEKYHNFALSSGVVVHNSQWDVMPGDRFCGKMFRVFVGGDTRRSRMLDDDEKITITQEEVDEGIRVIDVPVEYKSDFSKDIDDALRDIAGVETITIRPFLRRYEKILDAINSNYEHPFEDIEWETGKPIRFKLNKMIRRNRMDEMVPIINPASPRYIHLDPALTGDAFGFCMAHISGYVQVRRRNLQTHEVTVEEAPVIVVDFMLRIVPAMGDEIDHGRVRSMIYMLSEYGYPIHFVTMDSFQSIATKQKLKSKGYRSEIVSVDRPLDPYDNLKEVFYENRIVMYHYQPVIDELRYLILDGVKGKVDHLPERSKDVADALCGAVFTLSTRTTGVPLGIIEGATEGDELEDFSWVHVESKNLVPKEEREAEALTLEPLPPFV